MDESQVLHQSGQHPKWSAKQIAKELRWFDNDGKPAEKDVKRILEKEEACKKAGEWLDKYLRKRGPRILDVIEKKAEEHGHSRASLIDAASRNRNI